MKFECHFLVEMESSPVIHLVSNSLTHLDNTASKFKITCNVPFDLSGKQIALVDATLTKTLSNVVDEKMIFSIFGSFERAPTRLVSTYSPIPVCITLWSILQHTVGTS